MDKNQVMIVILACLAVAYVIYNTVQLIPVPLEKGIMHTSGRSLNEPFLTGSPLNQGIGAYSNIDLRYALPNSWRNETQMIPLNKAPIYSPQGTPLPLKDSNSFQQVYPTMGPSVDGQADSPKMMSMLAFNQAKPECCPSTFSTSTGCVCLTHQQSDWINRRGNNNTAPSDF
jgi:hypothetical protein